MSSVNLQQVLTLPVIEDSSWVLPFLEFCTDFKGLMKLPLQVEVIQALHAVSNSSSSV